MAHPQGDFLAVLGYQFFIILSLIFIRMVRVEFLIHAAIGWTIFTLVYVHVNWLIALQLFVVWATYALAAPKKDGN